MTSFRCCPPIVKAVLWMVGTLLSFAVVAVAVRELHAVMQTFEILFFRSLVGLAVTSLAIAKTGWSRLRTAQLKLQVIRNVIHYGGQFGWIYGIAVLPLAEVFAIEFTTPIWTAILAMAFLGERMNRGRYVAVILGFLAILIILRPGVEIIDPGALVVLISAMCLASAIICTKKLLKTETPLAIIFYMSLIQLPMGLIPALFQWVTPSLSDAPLLILVGLSLVTAHYCLARAFALADATIVAPMDFMRCR